MLFNKTKLFLLLFFGWISFSLTHPVSLQAQEVDPNFQTDIQTTYQVKSDGLTHVIYQVSITNLTPTKYINKYALTLNFSKLKNITASENGHYLNPHVVSDENSTSIALDFNHPVIGEGQKQVFQIEFDHPAIADITGNVLEVSIPKLTGKDYHSSKTTVIVPKQFGNPNHIQPKPSKIRTDNQNALIYFENIKNSSILLVFGDKQIFDLSLRYELVNQSQSEGLTQIAIPPNTHYQEVYYQSIDPPPTRLNQDQDGNWLATYKLAPSESKTIYVTLNAKLTIEDNHLPIPQANLSQYLKATKYWPINDPTIKEIVRENPSIYELYQYTVNNLNYIDNLNNLINRQRMGALGALEHPDDAACQEFSDLFITLARSSGVPARRLGGYGYSNNESLKPSSFGGDILHAWADYFDTETSTWKQVDPTWEKTTGGRDYFHHFDLNHITFAINGVSDTIPFAAGSYVSENTNNTQNVTVNLGSNWPEIEPSFSISLKKSRFSPPGVYTLEIKNENGAAWYNVKTDFTLKNQNAKIIPLGKIDATFLPFEEKTVKLMVVSQNALPHKTSLDVHFNLDNKQHYLTSLSSNITAVPTFGLESSSQKQLLSIGIGVFVILSILIWGTVVVIKLNKK